MPELPKGLTPLIFAFVADLMAAQPIETAAGRLGYRVRVVARASDIVAEHAFNPAGQAAEPVFGPQADLVEAVTASQPALIIFDLANEMIPWREWLAVLKSSPATRRIPVVCFGPHVRADLFRAARERAADAVVARSRFFADLPALIERNARRPDLEAIHASCRQPLSQLAQAGIAAFNRGDYFEAHELLEEAWIEDEGAGQELYRAVLQVAVAYLQIERANYVGAVKMFLRARQWLRPLPAECRGLDIGRLRADADAVHLALSEAGLEGVADFDRSLLRPVRLTATQSGASST
ncbi:MAG: DUF309 domain-containing protein [Candidatus Promineifilaceae bacterium]